MNIPSSPFAPENWVSSVESYSYECFTKGKYGRLVPSQVRKNGRQSKNVIKLVADKCYNWNLRFIWTYRNHAIDGTHWSDGMLKHPRQREGLRVLMRMM